MVRMGIEFLKLPHYKGMPVNEAYIEDSFRSSIANASFFALVLEVDGEAHGMLCAMTSRALWAPIGFAIETCMWIDPGHRGGDTVSQMIEDYSTWAKDMGCHHALLTAPPIRGMSFNKLYARSGFFLDGVNYRKDL